MQPSWQHSNQKTIVYMGLICLLLRRMKVDFPSLLLLSSTKWKHSSDNCTMISHNIKLLDDISCVTRCRSGDIKTTVCHQTLHLHTVDQYPPTVHSLHTQSGFSGLLCYIPPHTGKTPHCPSVMCCPIAF